MTPGGQGRGRRNRWCWPFMGTLNAWHVPGGPKMMKTLRSPSGSSSPRSTPRRWTRCWRGPSSRAGPRANGAWRSSRRLCGTTPSPAQRVSPAGSGPRECAPPSPRQLRPRPWRRRPRPRRRRVGPPPLRALGPRRTTPGVRRRLPSGRRPVVNRSRSRRSGRDCGNRRNLSSRSPGGHRNPSSGDRSDRPNPSHNNPGGSQNPSRSHRGDRRSPRYGSHGGCRSRSNRRPGGRRSRSRHRRCPSQGEGQPRPAGRAEPGGTGG